MTMTQVRGALSWFFLNRYAAIIAGAIVLFLIVSYNGWVPFQNQSAPVVSHDTEAEKLRLQAQIERDSAVAAQAEIDRKRLEEDKKDPEVARLKAEAARIRAQIELDEAEAARKEAQRRRELAAGGTPTPPAATPSPAGTPVVATAPTPSASQAPGGDPELARQMDVAKQRGATMVRKWVEIPKDGTWSRWTAIGQCKWSITIPNTLGWEMQIECFFSDNTSKVFTIPCTAEGINSFDARDKVTNLIRFRWSNVARDPVTQGCMTVLNIERPDGMPEPNFEIPEDHPAGADAPAAPAPAVIDPPTTAPKTDPTTKPESTTPSARGSTNNSSTIHLASGRKVLGTGSYRGKGTMTGRGSYTGKGTLVGQGSYQGPGTLQ